jgi:hypothetical protein
VALRVSWIGTVRDGWVTVEAAEVYAHPHGWRGYKRDKTVPPVRMTVPAVFAEGLELGQFLTPDERVLLEKDRRADGPAS